MIRVDIYTGAYSQGEKPCLSRRHLTLQSSHNAGGQRRPDARYTGWRAGDGQLIDSSYLRQGDAGGTKVKMTSVIPGAKRRAGLEYWQGMQSDC